MGVNLAKSDAARTTASDENEGRPACQFSKSVSVDCSSRVAGSVRQAIRRKVTIWPTCIPGGLARAIWAQSSRLSQPGSAALSSNARLAHFPCVSQLTVEVRSAA